MKLNRKQSFHRILLVLSLVGLLAGTLAACGSPAPAPTPTPTPPPASPYQGKKVLWVDSYHEGYAWSDGIGKGIQDTLAGTGVELKIVRMDTKNNPGEEFAEVAGENALAEINAYGPDVVIASDDNAQKYLVVPYLKDTAQPVVFCGVNWDASIYDFPASNVTGMVEVELPDRMVEHLKSYAQGEKVAYLTVDTETERKVAEIYQDRFFGENMQPYWVNTFEEFQAAFIQAQDEVDILFFGNNAGIDRWVDDEVVPFITENTRIPSGTINDWLAPYVLLTLAKSSEEQGEWSAEAALSILAGTPASGIAVAENKREVLILNLDIAEKLEVVFAPSLLRNAEVYSSGETAP